MARERRIVTYTGTVQGVGFRYTACRVASGFEVTGTVRNLPDGSVELVAQGDHEEIDRFCGAVAEAMGGLIRDARARTLEAGNEFEGFNVRF